MFERARGLFSNLRSQIVRGANSILGLFRGEGGSVNIEIDTTVLEGIDQPHVQDVMENIIDQTVQGLDALQYFTSGENLLDPADFSDNSLRIEGPFLTVGEAQGYLDRVASSFGSPSSLLQIKYLVTIDPATEAEEYEFYVWWCPSC